MAKKSGNLPGRSAFRQAVERKGSILIIALWSLCLLTNFAVSMGYGVRQKIALVKRLDERDRLYLIAEAGVMKAISALIGEDPKTYDSLTDNWSSDTDTFKDIEVENGIANVSYGYISEKAGLPEIGYGLVDEERKININKTELGVLQRLLMIVLHFDDTQAQELAASIIDWRDGDSGTCIPSGSAEDQYYSSLSVSYEAKDSNFDIPEEILLVKGMNEDIYRQIKDYITIYGEGKVNVNTASRPVLLALGLSDSVVDNIMLFRYGEDGVIGTADDKVFDLSTNIVPMFSRFYPLNGSEIAQITVVAERSLVTSSANFMIRSVANLDNRKASTEIDCVVNRTGNILRWQVL